MPVFHYLQFRTFAHETEDPARVRTALANAAQGHKLQVEETSAEGSHKNRILILEATVKSAAVERGLFEALARDDPRGFRRLAEETPRRLDEHLNYFLRLDKQEAYLGRMVVGTGDDAVTVRGKLRVHPATPDPMREGLDLVGTFLERVGFSKG